MLFTRLYIKGYLDASTHSLVHAHSVAFPPVTRISHDNVIILEDKETCIETKGKYVWNKDDPWIETHTHGKLPKYRKEKYKEP